VDLSARPFTIRGTDTTVRAHSVIIATGATAKKLGIPSEQQVGSWWGFWVAGVWTGAAKSSTCSSGASWLKMWRRSWWSRVRVMRQGM
jgi:hypothetical protein